jgi:hypothetical protein
MVNGWLHALAASAMREKPQVVRANLGILEKKEFALN